MFKNFYDAVSYKNPYKTGFCKQTCVFLNAAATTLIDKENEPERQQPHKIKQNRRMPSSFLRRFLFNAARDTGEDI